MDDRKQPKKSNRASTSSKNRPRSPSPYRSRAGQSTSEFVNEFWQHTVNTAETLDEDFKHQALPLARIKKVMKSDPEVRMISSEVTVLFEKACQIFIQELTARSHLVSLASRRRTLSRPDVAQAISKSDMFDFLIDIVPREEGWEAETGSGVAGGVKKKSKGKGKAKAGNKKRRHEDDDDGGGPDDDDDDPAALAIGDDVPPPLPTLLREDEGAKSIFDQIRKDSRMQQEALMGQQDVQNDFRRVDGLNWTGGGFDYTNVEQQHFFNPSDRNI